jgi:hypothetical protein
MNPTGEVDDRINGRKNDENAILTKDGFDSGGGPLLDAHDLTDFEDKLEEVTDPTLNEGTVFV